VATARTLTSPAVHPRSGETIFPGLSLGTELGWATKIGGPAPNPLGSDFVKYAVFKNPDWDWRTFNLESAVALAARIDVTDASADLRAFMRRGGKLLLYHGWADQNFSAQSTVDYYRRVVDTVGSPPQTGDWLRLFLAPGMGHCGGGEGPNTFDMVSALERWVENNQPPALVVASQSTNGKLGRTRPLCPYPRVARYNGTGSVDDASHFACVVPQR
jgi:feruloyl esterase